jgi:conserved hypothetical integral membrane protein TIGR02206
VIEFRYFNEAHIGLLLLCFVVGYGALILPRYFASGSPEKSARFMGRLILLIVVYEMYYRLTYEGFSWGQVMPLHFCSVSVIAAGFYLWTLKNQYFQIAYYFSFGALLALLFPGIGDYHHHLYFGLFMVTHGAVIFAVFYGIRWFGACPNWEGFKYAAKLCLLLFAISFFWNETHYTNFMFTKAYLLPAFQVINPFWVYQILLVGGFLLGMFLMYLPHRRNDEN